MKSSEKRLNIQFTDKALEFIKKRRLSNPLVMVNMGYRSGGGDSSGCGGGCSGGGCSGGGGGSTSYMSYINVMLVDGGTPSEDFVKIDTQAGVPVYVARLILDRMKGSEQTVFITLKGMVMKTLSLEGLNLAGQEIQKGAANHRSC